MLERTAPDRRRRVLSLVVTGLLAGFVVFSLATADPPAQDRARQIGSLIRCPVCSGDSIADSPAPLAVAMMDVVRESIDEGLSDEQIIDRLLASYTDSQRLDPEVSPATVALWLVPGTALLIGFVLIAGEIRSERSEHAGEPPTRAPVSESS